MKKTTTLFCVFFLLNCLGMLAQGPTFSEDAAPIFYKHCTTCHRQDGIGASVFILESYQDAKLNAGAIRNAVENREMPPWPPDTKYSRFAHEMVLTDTEINTIVDWVDNGRLRGDSLKEPKPPVFPKGSELGIANLKLSIPTYTSNATTEDVYRCFVIPSGLTQDHYIRTLDAIPGNRSIVHHVLVYTDTTGECKKLDVKDPAPGYQAGFGGVGNNSVQMIGAWVPGLKATFLPTGMGVRIPKNADIVVQIHYPKGTNGIVDSTSLHFFYTPTNNNVRRVYVEPLLDQLKNMVDGPLYIPANTEKTFHEKYIVGNKPITLLSVAPHMHTVGRRVTAYALAPFGSDTTKLIHIPDWDFHWQELYDFLHPVKLAAYSTITGEAHYDNTTNNPENPNNPPKDVFLGESTTDEMMLVYFRWTYYQPGDENIVVDSSYVPTLVPEHHFNKAVKIYPNPTRGSFYLNVLDHEGEAVISIFDVQGKAIYQEQVSLSNDWTKSYQLPSSAKGIYFVRVKTDKNAYTERITIE